MVAPPAGDRFSPEVSPATVRDRAHERPLEITYLGNVVARKGLDALVEGLARVGGPGADDSRVDGPCVGDPHADDPHVDDPRAADWRLTVVGDATVEPAFVDDVRDRVADLGIADRVRFAGRLDDDAVASRLRETHVLAVPSRYEPFGMAYLEAMGFGCVPLAAAAGGASECVRDGENGFLVPPDDPAAIADRIRRLTDRDRLAEMGVTARRDYAAWPTWTETADVAVDFLESLAATEGR
ncbi:glycosyltransferase family 4 protein [Halorubrum sp. CBA1125]|uniref:glycosyltransferase family 4 protein n=1 Tax=Halorubrum sp. CBA1125 TaxID=2668072 RepID=UPI002AA2A50D|nr:glycosyltransferase family 4 protein [Halorubrum sp. CBA1125]